MGSDFSRPMRYGRSSRKPKYRSVGVQTDPKKYSIGVETDFPDDDINHYYGIDHPNPRNNGAHANPNTNTETTRSFGIQADSSDDDDDDDHEENHKPSFPRRYTSAEKAKGVVIDDEVSECSSQYPPIYDSDRSGPSCYRPFPQHQERPVPSYHYQEPQNLYQNWQRMEEEVPHCGGYEMPCSYGGSNYCYEPPQTQSWAWTGYHANNNYGSYFNDYDMPHRSSMVRALDDPWSYEPQYGQNEGVSWRESFSRDAVDQIFGGVYPYYQAERY